MIKKTFVMFLVFIFVFLTFIPISYAAVHRGVITGSNVNVRRGPGTGHGSLGTLSNRVVRMPDHTIHRDQGGCAAGWYRVFHNNNLTDIGFVCANFVSLDLNSWVDPWGRGWNTPKRSIMGGARFIANSYIGRGQYTSYYQKFNVNPASDRARHTHQYMTNIMAPFTEAQTSFNAYNASGLINRPLVFSIPIFDHMPHETNLGGYTRTNHGTHIVTNQDFENHMAHQGFPETYRSRLRVLNQKYPNWVFQAVHTRLNWDDSVSRQRAVGAIHATNSSSINWPHRDSVNPIEGSTWWRPTLGATAYFLDPRNFLDEVRIMQFERLNFSSAFGEADVQVVLQNTFMRGVSELDNQSFASIFMEAGQAANVNPVHLASRARLEVGSNGSRATTGAQFTYRGIVYSGLYNFFNIGAFSSDPESPVLAGLVWGTGGLCERCEGLNFPGIPGLPPGANNNFILGDVTGTGAIDVSDIVALRQHILGLRPLEGNFLAAADVNRDGRVDVADIVAIRQHITGQRLIN